LRRFGYVVDLSESHKRIIQAADELEAEQFENQIEDSYEWLGGYGADQRGGRTPIPSSVKREVWRRDEGRCVECGRNGKLEFDHIIPLSEGGSDTVRNLQLLCEKCNRSKSNEIM